MNLPEENAVRKVSKRHWLLRFLRISVTVSILVLFVIYLPLPVLWVSLKKVSLVNWGGCVVGALLAHLLGIVKWRLQLRATHVHLGFGSSARCYCAGLFANVFLPSVVGGDVVRTGLAMRATKSKWNAVIGGLMDRLGDVVGLLLLATLGSLFVPAVLGSKGRIILFVVALGLALIGVSGIGLMWYRPRSWWPLFIRRQAKRLRIALWRVVQNYRLGLIALGLSLCIQSSFVLMNHFLGESIGMVLPLGLWFFVWPLAKLAALIPISLGGIGVQELAFAGLLKPFGVTPALAVAQALLWRGVFVATGLIGGLTWILLDRRIWQPSQAIGGLKGERV